MTNDLYDVVWSEKERKKLKKFEEERELFFQSLVRDKLTGKLTVLGDEKPLFGLHDPGDVGEENSHRELEINTMNRIPEFNDIFYNADKYDNI
jgi:hypothetical protein